MSRKGLGEAPGLFAAIEGRAAAEAKPAKAGRKTKPVPAAEGPAGHRDRLKARFAAGGADALPDYELLELVLFNAVPRQDMKPLAKRLIAAFGDFNHAVAAPPARLREIEGVGDAVIHQLKLIEAAAQRLTRTQAAGARYQLSSWSAVLDYLRARLAHATVEEFRILFLDRKNTLIADEAQGRGTVDTVAVHVREVVKRALELNASALILVHNHPSGDPTPSDADVQMTRAVKAALATVKIQLHDHLIVGKGREASLQALGLV